MNLNSKQPKVTLRGIFPGSRVERGPDWYYGNEVLSKSFIISMKILF